MVESSSRDSMLLPPGFRFHPTDEEVISSYLLQKLLNPSFTSLPVGEVDLNKCEPWDLPSRAKMGEKEWYFFCHKDMKYPTGMRTNRATREGYWKATGKDKEIFSKSKTTTSSSSSPSPRSSRMEMELVGMKKTLVFYMGRAPRGSKTNWVMHEFRLHGAAKNNPNLRLNPKDEWVVCKVFHKKGEAKPAKAAVDYGYSTAGAATPPSASSADDRGDDFPIDAMIDPVYFDSSSAGTGFPATTTAPADGGGYPVPVSTAETTSFVLPNYGRSINTRRRSHQQFFTAVANSVPTSSSYSWNHMLPAPAPASSSHGVGAMGGSYSYSNSVSMHRDDDHQAAMVKALGGGVMAPNHPAVSNKSLPSLTTTAGSVWQLSSLGVLPSTIGSADSLGARLVHY